MSHPRETWINPEKMKKWRLSVSSHGALTVGYGMYRMKIQRRPTLWNVKGQLTVGYGVGAP
jgi:hypothetical protein